MQNNPLADDLNHIMKHTEGLWEDLRGKRLFITGGTGFFGRWLLESFVAANESLNLNASAHVLTRNYNIFKKDAPHLASNPAITFYTGDVRDFKFPEGEFSHIIHAAATSAVATFKNEDLLKKFDTVVEGTRHTLDFAVQCNAEKFLFTSSGSVYGRQPSDMTHIPEDYCGATDPCDPNSAWGEGKRAAEFLCAYYSKKYGIGTKVARCFTFVGPYLQLDIHYAVGNFIRDALTGCPVRVGGDGTAYRSYLYAADLTIWLWTILFIGESCTAYNVGSEDDITIRELANIVANSSPKPVDVLIAETPDTSKRPERYVPLTKRAQTRLGICQLIDIKTAIERTIAYYDKKYLVHVDR